MEMNNLGLTLALDCVNGGGAERFTLNLASCMADKGREVTLITFTSAADKDFYPVDPRIKRIHLYTIEIAGFTRSKWGEQEENIEKLRVALRQAGNRKVLAIMSKMSIRCLLADDKREFDIYACERSYSKYSLFLRLDEYLRRLLYPLAKRVVIQVDKGGNREWLEKNIPGCNIAVIPNFIMDSVLKDMDNCRKHTSKYEQERYILNCGRLVEVKQHDKLLKAYARMRSLIPELNVRLKIAGIGKLEPELKELARCLGIENMVDFLGWRDDIYSLMKGAEVFALTSAYEGFPNVLLEALACGVPAIAFDCISGPSDIITHDFNGYLVEPDNVDEFAKALCKICSDGVLRETLSANALQVRETFSQEKIMNMWERMIFEG